MTQSDTIITISDVLEYLFCPRFIYFMHCLDIPQHEESRFKVLKGREVHEEKRITNPEYLRKKLGVVKKELNVFIASKKNHIKGIVDEVLFLDDGSAAPFEYKFAEFTVSPKSTGQSDKHPSTCINGLRMKMWTYYQWTPGCSTSLHPHVAEAWKWPSTVFILISCSFLYRIRIYPTETP